ncbi:MAG: DUF6531 domain-containing protein, partial [Planctomycetota bacterium]
MKCRVTLFVVAHLIGVGATDLTMQAGEVSLPADAANRPAAKVRSIDPDALVNGVRQVIRLRGHRTQFGPETQVYARSDDVRVGRVFFVSREEILVPVHPVVDSPIEDRGVRLRVVSCKRDGSSEELEVRLDWCRTPTELGVEFLDDQSSIVETDRKRIAFSYRPRGYAPFQFTVADLCSGRVVEQTTSAAVETLGVPVLPGSSTLRWELRDALGRSIHGEVRVDRRGESREYVAFRFGDEFPDSEAPTTWESEPTQQPPLSECEFANGIAACDDCPEGIARSGTGPGGGGGGVELRQSGVELRQSGVELPHGRFAFTAVDLNVPSAGPDLSWTRTYRSDLPIDGVLGRHSDSNYFRHAIVDDPEDPQTLWISRGDGRLHRYADFVDGKFRVLPEGSADRSVVVRNQEIVQTTRDGTVFSYDLVFGLLKSRRTIKGSIHLLYHYTGQLAQAENEIGDSIHVSYGTTGAASGRVTEIRSGDRRVRYEYQSAGVDRSVLTNVSYPERIVDDGRSVERKSPEIHYAFDPGSSRIAVVSNDLGEQIRNAFDADGRLVAQWTSDRGNTQFFYVADEGRVSEVSSLSALGALTTRRFDERGFPIEVSREIERGRFETSRMEYDCQGCRHLASLTQPGGRHLEMTISGDLVEIRHFEDTEEPFEKRDGRDVVYRARYARIAAELRMVTYWPAAASERGQAPDLHRVLLEYNAAGVPVRATFPSDVFGRTGLVVDRVVNDYGRTIEVSTSEGHEVQILYVESGLNKGRVKERRVKIKERRWGVTSFRYSDDGRVVWVTDPNGHTTRFDLNWRGQLVAVTPPESDRPTKVFTYDSAGRVACQKTVKLLPDGTVDPEKPRFEIRYRFEGTNRLVLMEREIDENRRATERREHDVEGRLKRIWNANGVATRLDRDLGGRVRRVVEAEGTPVEAVTAIAYDDAGRVSSLRRVHRESEKEEATLSVHYEYSPFNRPVVISRRWNGKEVSRRETQYDLTARRTSSSRIVDGEEVQSWSAEYGWNGFPRSESYGVEPSLRTMRYGFTDAGELRWVSGPDEGATVFLRNDAGWIESVLYPTELSKRRSTIYEYDDAGYVTGVREREADATGLGSSVTRFLRVSRDDRNRISAVVDEGTDPDDGKSSIETYAAYDSSNRPQSLKDTLGHQWRVGYDARGLPIEVSRENPENRFEAIEGNIERDLVGNVISRIDSNGDATRYSYDELNRIQRVDRPDGSFVGYTRNSLGQVIGLSYGIGDKASVRVTQIWSEGGRTLRREIDSGEHPEIDDPTRISTTQEYRYSGAGHLVYAADDDTRCEFGYSPFGELTRESLSIRNDDGTWSVPRETRSVHRQNGDLTVSSPLGFEDVTYRVNPSKKVIGIELGDQPLASYEYQQQRITRRDRQTGSGKRIRTDYEYD